MSTVRRIDGISVIIVVTIIGTIDGLSIMHMNLPIGKALEVFSVPGHQADYGHLHHICFSFSNNKY